MRMTGTLALLLAATALAPDTASAQQAGSLLEVFGPRLREPDLPEATPPDTVDPALARMVALALAHASEIRAARAGVRAAGYDIRTAQWQRFPSLSVDGLALAYGDGDRTTREVRLDVPLWAGGRIDGGVALARAERQVAVAGFYETAFDVAGRAIDLYYQILGSAARLDVLVRSRDRHRALVGRIERRVTAGVSPEADRLLAESRTAQIEQDIALTQAQQESARAQLRELIGGLDSVPAQTNPNLERYAFGDEGVIDAALGCSPSLQRLRAGTVAAQTRVRLARAQARPQLGLRFAHDGIFGNRVGLALSGSTGGGLSASAGAAAAQQRVTASELELRTAERKLRETVSVLLIENSAARQRAATGASATAFSEAVQASYERQYVAGRRTWLDLMNAVREASAAEAGKVDAEVAAAASAAQLTLRTCRWIGAPAP